MTVIIHRMKSELMNSQNGVLGELMKNECTRFRGVIYSLNFFIKGTILANDHCHLSKWTVEHQLDQSLLLFFTVTA